LCATKNEKKGYTMMMMTMLMMMMMMEKLFGVSVSNSICRGYFTTRVRGVLNFLCGTPQLPNPWLQASQLLAVVQ
jgi:hypothetical protein